MKILICGLPGSGKSTLAEPFADLIGGIWINADKVREKYNDWDFTPEGRIRQAQRMKHLADGICMAEEIAVADFVCPTKKAREEFDADYIVWMDTIKEDVLKIQIKCLNRLKKGNTIITSPSGFRTHTHNL